MASGINNKPIQTLYGHDDEVTCVALSSQLDMAVSASKVSQVYDRKVFFIKNNTLNLFDVSHLQDTSAPFFK